MQTPVGPQQLEFLDGYMLRVMADWLRLHGAEESGFYEYYRYRIEIRKHALSPYDRALVDYMQGQFDRSRPVLHAGTGIGTLPNALAATGYRVAGIELDPKRVKTARHLRAAVGKAWPEIESRYELIEGTFPEAGGDWVGPDTILVFTNCGAGWDEALTTRMIEAATGVGDVLLDARLFGIVRDDPAKRLALLERFAAAGFTYRPIPEMPGGTFYHHLQRSLDSQISGPPA